MFLHGFRTWYNFCTFSCTIVKRFSVLDRFFNRNSSVQLVRLVRFSTSHAWCPNVRTPSLSTDQHVLRILLVSKMSHNNDPIFLFDLKGGGRGEVVREIIIMKNTHLIALDVHAIWSESYYACAQPNYRLSQRAMENRLCPLPFVVLGIMHWHNLARRRLSS